MANRSGSSRRKPGEVRDAIFDFFLEAQREATVAEIREAVAEKFKGELAPSSVRSYLRLNTPQNFESPSEGVYRLKKKATGGRHDQESVRRHKPAFEYGRSVLFHADCIDWLNSRPQHSIHAIVTDPPYGIVEYSSKEQAKLRSGKGGVWRIPPSFDGHQRSPLPRFTVLAENDLVRMREFFTQWGRACLRVLVPGAHVAVAANPLLSYCVANAMVDAGFERRGEIIRLVMTMRGGDRPKNAHDEFPEISVMPRSMWEPWLLFRKPIIGRVQDNLRKWKTGGLRRPSLDKPFGDVIVSRPTRPEERKLAPHPSLKPQAFLRQLVRAILPMGEGIVLDPFAGSGSTLAAAEAVGYESIGIEKDEHFLSIARSAIPALHRLKIPKAQDDKPNSYEKGLFPPLQA